MASAIPDGTFIFAHMFGDFLIKIIEKINNKDLPRLENVYLEPSFAIIETKNVPLLSQAMRNFGINHPIPPGDTFNSDCKLLPVSPPRLNEKR